MALAHTEAANPHWTPRKKIGDLSHIPGENGPPIIGTTLRVLRDPPNYSQYMVRTYGKIFRVNAFGNPTVSMVGAEANELVMFDRDKLFSSEQGWGPVLNLLFPRGLMLMDFDHHRMDRRALGIAFKPEPMRGYVADMNRIFAGQLKNWRGDMLFYPAIKQLTLDVAAESFLGVPLGPEADKVNKAFVDMVQASIGVIRAPLPFTAMGRGVAGRKYLIDYFAPQIAERRNENRTDMFSQFCRATREDGQHMSDGEIIDHMNFLMMAAHDTITSSVTSMMWFLAKHPEWQEKLREECLSIAPAGADVAFADLDRFELTEYAFKEALRLVSPVPSIPRRALRDFEFMGYKIPKGTAISVSPGYVHQMEEYWGEDPATFDPMRFTPDKVKARHKYAWVPFGGGAHMCLGLHFAYLQMKLFIHHLLTQARVEVAEGYEPEWQPWPIPKPKDGLKVKISPL